MELSVGESAYVSFGHYYTNSYSSFARPYVQSSNTNVVRVDADTGSLLAVGPGTAYVTAYSKLSGDSPHCKVTVKKVDPTSVSIPSSMTAYVGESSRISATLKPSDAQTTFTWYSSNTSVAAVSSGTVTGKGEGGKEASCVVTVAEPKHCFIVWTKDGARVDYLMADHPVVTNEDDNLVLTTRNVRVEYPKADVRKYTFEDQTTDPYPTRIELLSALTLPYRQTMQMDYALHPLELDIETRLTWQSSAPHIVSVDQTGRLLARCNGEALITVTASNGVTASCLVAVTDAQLYLVVWTRDGGRVLYPLNEQPSIKHDGEGSYIVRTSAVEVEYPVADVRMFTLADTDNPVPEEPMAIPAVSADGGFNLSADRVSFSSLRPGSEVRIYNLSGVLQTCIIATSEGCASVSLAELPKGIYIVKTENITHKIIKK